MKTKQTADSSDEEALRAIFEGPTGSPPAPEQKPLEQEKRPLKERLADVLNTLTERERKVLELRFGLSDEYKQTLGEVGKQFKVTRERIRQIEAKALRKMRHPKRIKTCPNSSVNKR